MSGADPAQVPPLLRTGRWLVLTGAGLSTDSGVPDYRGPNAPARTPMTYQEFVATPLAQQRYWARAHVGWGRMRRATPNAGHHALARLQRLGAVSRLVTQNVDGLHEAAGSDVVALHGRIAQIVCLDCRALTGREAVFAQMDAANPGHVARHEQVLSRPDGDVDLETTAGYVVPVCRECGGRLKPHVVFFGENVPADRVELVYAALDAADGLLVVGSSLAVMSGFRFVRRAAKAAQPVVIANRGATRGDDLATVRLEAGCSEFLTAWQDSRESATAAVRPG